MPNATQTTALKITFAVCAALVALAVPLYLLPKTSLIIAVKHWGYWFMLGTCGLFLWQCWRASRGLPAQHLRASISAHWAGLLLAIVATAFLLLQGKTGFKVLYDEHVLSSTAMNLHLHQMAYTEAVSHVFDGEKIASIGHVDKRPLLFPFLLSAAHNLLGYDYRNVFGLNAVLTFVALALLYATISLIGHRTYAWLGILLIAGLPLIAENATGGGYELLNLCLILALTLSSIHYFNNTRHTGGLDLMIITAVLLANVRYESILYVLVPAVLFLIKSIRRKQIELTWFSVFSPLLLILPLMSYAVFKNDPQFIHTSREDFFNLSYLPENLSHALSYLTNWRGDYSNSLLLTLLGATGIGAFLICFAPALLNLKNGGDRITPVFIVLAVILINTLVALSNEWGEWVKPEAARFSLPLHLAMVLCLAPAFTHGFRLKKAPGGLILAAALYLLLITPLHCLRIKQENRLIIPAGYQLAMRWAEESAPPGNHLFIAQSASGLGLLNKAAIPFSLANAKPEKVRRLQELGIYDNIYSIEALIKLDKETTLPLPGAGALSQNFKRAVAAEYQINDKAWYRISQLTGINQISRSLEEASSNRHINQEDNRSDWSKIYELLPLHP